MDVSTQTELLKEMQKSLAESSRVFQVCLLVFFKQKQTGKKKLWMIEAETNFIERVLVLI